MSSYLRTGPPRMTVIVSNFPSLPSSRQPLTRIKDRRDAARRPSLAGREPGPTNRRFARILLATEGRPIPDLTIARALELVPWWGASVRVFSIVRIYGHSGAMPTKSDWDRQRTIVADAIKRLRSKRLEVHGDVLATRRPARQICDEATKHGCEAIVMAADPSRNRLVGDMLWAQEPQRVRRRARVPVFLVFDG